MTDFGIDDLFDLEFLQGVVFSILSIALKEIDTTGFEPGIWPPADIKVVSHDLAAIVLLVISFLETWDEVGEFCVFPGVFSKVDVESIFQGLLSENTVNLL